MSPGPDEPKGSRWNAATARDAAAAGGDPVRIAATFMLIIPDRTRQQVLQPVRPAMPDRLRDRPAVVIFQLHQQAADHLAAGLPGLPPGKTPGYPPQQVRQQRRPGLIRYRGNSDCRVLIVSHNPS